MRSHLLAVLVCTPFGLTGAAAQAIEPGKFSGVLVLDPMSGLAKWDVLYKTTNGDGLRAEMQKRFGDPTSDISGNIFDDESETVRQRCTIWQSTAWPA